MENLTALYSFKGQEPQPLPERIRLSNGSTKTDISSFTEEDLVDAGFSGPYAIPSFDQEYQRIFWDSETLSFVIEDISDDEIWDRVRKERNRRLAESDWTMAADAPEDLNFREWEMYRQRLRDLPSFYETPQDVIWPQSPEGRSDEDFDQPRVYEDRILWRVRDLEKAVQRLTIEVFPQPVGIASTEV